MNTFTFFISTTLRIHEYCLNFFKKYSYSLSFKGKLGGKYTKEEKGLHVLRVSFVGAIKYRYLFRKFPVYKWRNYGMFISYPPTDD